MPSLDEFTSDQVRGGRVSVVDLLPDGVRDQLVAAQLAGSKSTRLMVEWLHNDPDLPDVCRRVTRSMLHNYFVRRGIRFGGGRGES